MATSPTPEPGADRSNVASSGRGGRGGGGRSQGRGRGRSNGNNINIIPNAQVRKKRDEGITSNPSEEANGGRSSGGGRRHFSARGGGGAGRGKSGGKGSASTSLEQPAVAEPSVEEVKGKTDQVGCKQFAKHLYHVSIY